MVPAVAAVDADLAAAGGRRLQRVPLEDPVADVHHVDVLLHQDVAREHAVIYPVANPALDGRSIRPGGAVDRARVVVGLTASDFPERAAMDALRQFDKRRGVADLESYVQADLALRLLSDSDDLLGAVDVHRHRLFAVNVLAGGDDGFKMRRMKIRRRRDDDRVHFFRRGDLLVGLRAFEHLRSVNARVPFRLPQLVEVLLGRLELVLEEVSESHDPRRVRVDEVSRIGVAAPAASQEPHPDCGQ